MLCFFFNREIEIELLCSGRDSREVRVEVAHHFRNPILEGTARKLLLIGMLDHKNNNPVDLASVK